MDHVSPEAASAGPVAPGGSQGSLSVKDETTSGVATLTSTASSNLFADLDQDTSGKRSIFQTFWKLHCCPDFLFFELDLTRSIETLKSKLGKIGGTLFFDFLVSCHNLKSLTQKTKNRGNNTVCSRFGKYSYQEILHDFYTIEDKKALEIIRFSSNYYSCSSQNLD